MRATGASHLGLGPSNLDALDSLNAASAWLGGTLTPSDLSLDLLLRTSRSKASSSNLVLSWLRTTTRSHRASSSKLVVVRLGEWAHRSVLFILRVIRAQQAIQVLGCCTRSIALLWHWLYLTLFVWEFASASWLLGTSVAS